MLVSEKNARLSSEFKFNEVGVGPFTPALLRGKTGSIPPKKSSVPWISS